METAAWHGLASMLANKGDYNRFGSVMTQTYNAIGNLPTPKTINQLRQGNQLPINRISSVIDEDLPRPPSSSAAASSSSSPSSNASVHARKLAELQQQLERLQKEKEASEARRREEQAEAEARRLDEQKKAEARHRKEKEDAAAHRQREREEAAEQAKRERDLDKKRLRALEDSIKKKMEESQKAQEEATRKLEGEVKKARIEAKRDTLQHVKQFISQQSTRPKQSRASSHTPDDEVLEMDIELKELLDGYETPTTLSNPRK